MCGDFVNVNNQGFIAIKEHTRRKYRILKKYLGACKRFSDTYQNFVYVDTHGGTGEVFDLNSGVRTEGSTKIAGTITPSFPCHSIEIDSEKYRLLEESTRGLPHVFTYHGDCNEKINEILKKIPAGQKFVLFFVDPDALIYDGGDFTCDQVKWETVEKIANFPRSEILMNFPVRAVMGNAGLYQSCPEAPSSQKIEERITALYGTDKWKEIDSGDYRSLVRLFISERLGSQFRYKGAVLIRTEPTRGPLYYLIYGSNYWVGPKIMRSNMKIEWLDSLGMRPLTRHNYKTEEEWLDGEYPLDLFIFED